MRTILVKLSGSLSSSIEAEIVKDFSVEDAMNLSIFADGLKACNVIAPAIIKATRAHMFF